MNTFTPKFTITNRMTATITKIERSAWFSGSGKIIGWLSAGYGG